MNKPITQDEINRLRAPFPLEAHSIREGNKTSTGKIQWFVYLEKTEVEIRLNEVFPGEWGSSQPVLTPLGNAVAATISITIRGIERGNTGEDSNGQEKAKGATTDAFRRAAADWGVAKYLWEMDDMIYTDGYEKGEWDKQKQRKNEAFAKFKTWYQKKFANYKPSNIAPLPVESRVEPPSSDLVQKDVPTIRLKEFDALKVKPTVTYNGKVVRNTFHDTDAGKYHIYYGEMFDAENGFQWMDGNTLLVVETPNAAEAAKSKLGTPNGQTIAPRAGRWAFDRNALLTQLSTWAQDHSYQERNNTVKAMDTEGAFAECADIGEAVQLVVARLATHKKAAVS